MAKHLAQIIMTGAQVVGRAFAKALRQEIAASQAAASRAGGGAKGAQHSATNQKLGMTVEEAKQILNVDELDQEKIQKNFDYLFNINDKSKGGTLYLQSKMRESRLRLYSGISHRIDNMPLLSNQMGSKQQIGISPYSTCIGVTWDTILTPENRALCVEKLKHLGSEENVKILPTMKSVEHNLANYSAVLVPMCHVKGELCFLYTLRTNDLRSHRREVSFPGGKMEPNDTSIYDTALREAEEEIGLDRKSVDIWGSMPPQQGKFGQASIVSILGYIGEVDENSFCLSPQEVDSVFAVSLKNLCCPNNCRQTQFRSKLYKNGFTMPIFIGSDPKIWGLTAIITHLTMSALLPDLYKHRLYHVTY